MFKISTTFDNPANGSNAQRGFPAVGAGAQVMGNAQALPIDSDRAPSRPTKGVLSWLFPWRDQQRGYPTPGAVEQQRYNGSMPNSPPVFGGVFQKRGPVWDNGASDWVPNFGKVLSNPIGAGIVAKYRPQASYGSAGQYANGAIWWSNRIVPTSTNLTALQSPDEIAALLDTLQIQAVVRTTG